MEYLNNENLSHEKLGEIMNLIMSGIEEGVLFNPLKLDNEIEDKIFNEGFKVGVKFGYYSVFRTICYMLGKSVDEIFNNGDVKYFTDKSFKEFDEICLSEGVKWK